MRQAPLAATSGNTATSDPGLVAGKMQAIVSTPVGGQNHEFVLPLSGADDLVTDSAAVPVTATHPYVGRKTSGQVPGPNAFLGECQNLCEFHQH
jgi:hypothetical protein